MMAALLLAYVHPSLLLVVAVPIVVIVFVVYCYSYLCSPDVHCRPTVFLNSIYARHRSLAAYFLCSTLRTVVLDTNPMYHCPTPVQSSRCLIFFFSFIHRSFTLISSSAHPARAEMVWCPPRA